MKRLLLVAALFLTFPMFVNSAAHDDLIVKKDSKVNLAIIKFLQAGVTERDNNKADVGEYLCKRSGASGCNSVDSLGEGICKAGGGSSCYSVDSIGEGICKAGGGSSCYSVDSIGEGICKAGGGSGCYAVDSIGEGICKAGKGSNCFLVKSITHGLDRISKEDRYWYWDRFSDQYGSPQWRCRGSQTGQFANNSKCSGQLKDDKRWPD
tara:strand:- start:147 stop:770 length:624 start_codon:yes stop_codon:yes gene_type:complete